MAEQSTMLRTFRLAMSLVAIASSGTAIALPRVQHVGCDNEDCTLSTTSIQASLNGPSVTPAPVLSAPTQPADFTSPAASPAPAAARAAESTP
ncbi:hypothetical protein ACJ72_08648 [Emergomyces africanus]|uniref:Uncharacterized protein n=1 Tax=Emergomyces africanus TaxID=1955775 RepID=A0A1B7NKB4_9EURO|nr:hypothetical protein ACJ72_08648 [Emergomyces africanus]